MNSAHSFSDAHDHGNRQPYNQRAARFMNDAQQEIAGWKKTIARFRKEDADEGRFVIVSRSGRVFSARRNDVSALRARYGLVAVMPELTGAVFLGREEAAAVVQKLMLRMPATETPLRVVERSEYASERLYKIQFVVSGLAQAGGRPPQGGKVNVYGAIGARCGADA